MNLRADRDKANAAANRLALRQRRYRRSKNDLGADIATWQPVVLVGGGLIAGSLLSRLRIARVARAAMTTVSVTMMIARTTFGSIALAALFGRHITDEAGSDRAGIDHGSKPSA